MFKFIKILRTELLCYTKSLNVFVVAVFVLLVMSCPQVVFGGDPEAALIQYTANDEARRAISSTEAVLNNRFIRVYWHREATANTQEQGPSQSTNPGQQHPPTHKVCQKIVMLLILTGGILC